ncbi:SH2 domain-containing protein 1A-like isoform X2 [Genypterus blacodes]|uniref:SH2 domain-containing protein 1A-like isoform X2 n=1 Tax=Genypterus blacodes TaxID=154954 RepID=UPI003F76EE10
MDGEGLLVSCIYYGNIGGRATERLLETYGREGSFLLRDSETVQGAYCLCVRKTPFVHTYRLQHSTAGWSVQLAAGNGMSFMSLETLIESYSRGLATDVSLAPLTHPLDKTQLGDLGHESVYMEM